MIKAYRRSPEIATTPRLAILPDLAGPCRPQQAATDRWRAFDAELNRLQLEVRNAQAGAQLRDVYGAPSYSRGMLLAPRSRRVPERL